jgi:hypothetical protein
MHVTWECSGKQLHFSEAPSCLSSQENTRALLWLRHCAQLSWADVIDMYMC